MPVAEPARLALAWSKIPGVSLRRFWKACEAAGGWREIVGGDPSRWAGVVRSETAARLLARPFEVDVADEVAATDRSGTRLLTALGAPELAYSRASFGAGSIARVDSLGPLFPKEANEPVAGSA